MRPYRNPETNQAVMANTAYLEVQMNLPQGERNADWVFPPAENLTHLDAFVGDAVRVLTAAELIIYQRLSNEARDLGVGRINFGVRERDRRVEEMPSNIGVVKEYPPLNIDKLKAGPDIPRDIKLPPFKVDYDSHEQIHQKLNGTVILVKNRPFIVTQTVELKKGKFALLVRGNETPNQYVVNYDDVADCRGIAPGYFMYRGSAHWMYRVPDRQNSQGMHQRNMQYKTAGTKHVNSCRADMLLSTLDVVKDMPYAPNLHDLLLGNVNNSLRLNNRVALYLTGKKGAPIGVEYCGRTLGLIVNGLVKVMDEQDLQPSWIHRDLAKVDLAMSA